MIATIARKEFTEMIRDGRFRWSAGIVILLLIAALALGWQHYRDVRQQQQAAQTADHEQWLAQGERNPHSAAHFGKYAFKPSPPLSFVDRGLNSYTGIAIWMEAHYQNSSRNRPAEDMTTAGRFGELTAATVLQLLVPLLIILLTFSAFAGERETGTLRQLLSLGVRRRDLAVGKAGGVAAALLLLLIPATIIGVLALWLTSSTDSVLSSATRFAVMTITYLLYFGAFIGIALATSARSRSSRVALIVLLGFWIINGLVVPRVAADVSEAVFPARSRIEFWHDVNKEMREGIDGHNPQDKRREELKQRVLAEYQVARVEDLPINFSGIALQAGEEYGNTIFDKHYARLWQSYERQNRVHEVSALLAPLLAIRNVSMGVAGTDWAQHKDFACAAEAYRRVLNKNLNENYAFNSRALQTYVADRRLWEQAPPFEYQALSLGAVLANHAWSFVVLFVWFVGASSAAVLAASKMRVE